jgi:hypothetical protein
MDSQIFFKNLTSWTSFFKNPNFLLDSLFAFFFSHHEFMHFDDLIPRSHTLMKVEEVAKLNPTTFRLKINGNNKFSHGWGGSQFQRPPTSSQSRAFKKGLYSIV